MLTYANLLKVVLGDWCNYERYYYLIIRVLKSVIKKTLKKKLKIFGQNVKTI